MKYYVIGAVLAVGSFLIDFELHLDPYGSLMLVTVMVGGILKAAYVRR